MMNERINDLEKSADSDESTWELFSGFKSVSFLLLVMVATILLLREYRIYQSNMLQERSKQVPGDSDISHAVEDRLVAIESRLDALEGDSTPPEEEGEDDSVGESVEELPTTSYSSRRSRSKTTASADASSLEVPETTE